MNIIPGTLTLFTVLILQATVLNYHKCPHGDQLNANSSTLWVLQLSVNIRHDMCIARNPMFQLGRFSQ